jgi:hypothetical protein
LLLFKTVTVWAAELTAQIIVLALLWTWFSRDDPHEVLREVSTYATVVATMFFLTGYLVTTAVARLLCRRKLHLVYPPAAALLFFIHFELLNQTMGGIFEPSARSAALGVGIASALCTTLLGSVLLGGWISAKAAAATDSSI